MSLPTLEQLLRLQRGYYEVLSSWEERPWGLLGLNVANPGSHDSNHAYLTSPLQPRQLPQVLAELRGFYEQYGLGPRLRFHTPPNSPELARMGERLGWSARQEAETWRAWPARDQTEPWPRVPGLTLDVVRAEALEQLLLVQLEGSPKASKERVRRVWSCLCGDADCCCLIAHVNGEPAACLACVWRGGWGSVESVETRAQFRRRGICTAMMRSLQRIAVARGAHGLYLYDVEPGPDRIYTRVGFELVARTSLTSLWLEPPPLLPGCGTPPR